MKMLSFLVGALCSFSLSAFAYSGSSLTSLQKSELFKILPDYCPTPDGMAVAPNGDLILACPNFADCSVRVGAAIGFPLEQTTTECKAFETRDAIAQGATVHDVALMRRVVGPAIGVKAAGATRLGTSSGIELVTAYATLKNEAVK